MTESTIYFKNNEHEIHENESISYNPPRKQGDTLEITIENEDGNIDIDEKIHMENPYGDIYLNTESIQDIYIRNLRNVIIEKSENENDGFKKEYAVCG